MNILLPWTNGQYSNTSGIPQIDWNNPLTMGLVFYAWDTGDVCVDLVSGGVGTQVARTSMFRSNSAYGGGLNYGSASGLGVSTTFVIPAIVLTAVTSTNYSFMQGIITPVTALSQTSVAFLMGNTAGTEFLGFDNNAAGATWEFQAISGGAPSVGTYTPPTTGNYWTLAYTNSGTAAGTGIFYGSGLQQATATGGATAVAATDLIYVGCDPAAVYGDHSIGQTPFFGIWARALPPDQVLQIHNEPYGFLLPAEAEMPALSTGVVLPDFQSSGFSIFRVRNRTWY
jgi:hypothetical protein